ncbi:MAG: 3-hydroxybutyryl-CoA dehydrogenase [Candidatus Krumholzibacteriota bacterium]|nr:3-hydroxybutyryl-CoA dehydrogenase [Candidatus Krumholzibacteriota bacterium]
MNGIDRGQSIGVIGAGTMGRGIAQVAATFGHRTRVFDTDAGARDDACVALQKVFARLVEKGRVEDATASAILGRIEFVDALPTLGESALVIEAVVEDLGVKKGLFAELEHIVSPDAILASNTSSLSIAAISSACKHPGRMLGIHFFNPAPLLPLVEIIPCVRSNSDTLARARATVDAWGKTTVIAGDTPGFIVNRVARPFYGEALRILDEGIADVATIDYAMKEKGGFRMGPFELMDFIGNDINYTVTETVFSAFFNDPRYRPSITQQRLVESGLLGRKSGRGFYDHAEGAQRPAPEGDDALHGEIFDRVLAMLINEASDALFWNVATRDDIDLAMTKGVNYPKGLLRWADDIGLETVLSKIASLRETYSEDRYRPSPLLRRMVAAGETFYP